jgi:uncharacterized protein YbjQ (UPF0145 family)
MLIKMSSKNNTKFIVVTMSSIPGYEIVEALGTVHGITVRTRGVGGKIMAGIEGMFGGEVTSYMRARLKTLLKLGVEFYLRLQ